LAKQGPSRFVRAQKPRFFYGYIVVLAAFCIQVAGWGLISTFGVFFEPMQTEFGWSRALISGATSLSWLVVGLSSIVVGSLSDRFGPRMVMTVCGFLLGLGYLLMSQVSASWQLYVFYGLIVGMGASAVDVVLLATVARWFVKKRGMMSAVIKGGTGVGMLIMPLVASGITQNYGWDTSYIVIGIIALALIIPVSQLLKRDPGQLRQLPDGEERVATGDSDLAESGLSLREVTHTRQFWMISAAYLMIIFCANTMLTHIVRHAEDLGILDTSAAGILSTIGGVSIFGRLVMGYAGDRIGHKRAMIICFLIFVVTLSWLQFARELWALYLFAAVYGFGHGGFFSLISPMVAALFGTRYHGMNLGIVIFSGMVGGATGPFLTGYIFDITNNYQPAFLILLGFSIIGLILTALLKPLAKAEIIPKSST